MTGKTLVRILIHNPFHTTKNVLAAITKSQFDALELAEHYAAASYCPGNTIDSKKSAKLVCPKSNNCPKVESAITSITVGIKEYE